MSIIIIISSSSSSKSGSGAGKLVSDIASTKLIIYTDVVTVRLLYIRHWL